jgi:hypothetical protein
MHSTQNQEVDTMILPQVLPNSNMGLQLGLLLDDFLIKHLGTNNICRTKNNYVPIRERCVGGVGYDTKQR